MLMSPRAVAAVQRTVMAQNSENIEAKLCAYIDGELTDAERADIDRHLATNPDQKRLLSMLQDLRENRRVLRDLPRESAPAEMAEAMQAQMERSALLDDDEPVEREGVIGRIGQWPQAMSAAAIILLALGLGAVVYFVLPSNSNRPTVALKPESGAPAGGPTIRVPEKPESPEDATGPRLTEPVIAAPRPTTQAADAYALAKAKEIERDKDIRNLEEQQNYADMKGRANSSPRSVRFPTDDLEGTRRTVVAYLQTNNIQFDEGQKKRMDQAEKELADDTPFAKPSNGPRREDVAADMKVDTRDGEHHEQPGGVAMGGSAGGGGFDAIAPAATPPTTVSAPGAAGPRSSVAERHGPDGADVPATLPSARAAGEMAYAAAATQAATTMPSPLLATDGSVVINASMRPSQVAELRMTLTDERLHFYRQGAEAMERKALKTGSSTLVLTPGAPFAGGKDALAPAEPSSRPAEGWRTREVSLGEALPATFPASQPTTDLIMVKSEKLGDGKPDYERLQPATQPQPADELAKQLEDAPVRYEIILEVAPRPGDDKSRPATRPGDEK